MYNPIYLAYSYLFSYLAIYILEPSSYQMGYQGETQYELC